MSRRDTIIIAVLVNAGLLIVLFATAMRSGDQPSSEQAPLANASTQVIDPSNTASSFTEPEQIESLLDQYATLPTFDTPSTEEILFSNQIPPSSIPAEEVIAAPFLETQLSTDSLAVASSPIVSPPSVVTVTVKKGDVLEKIARANKSSVSAIMKENHLSSTQLKIGQVLKVPVKEGSSKSSSGSSEGEYYTVKEGDSPWLIASKNHVKLEELLRLNNLDDQKAKRLRPGDRLKIR